MPKKNPGGAPLAKTTVACASREELSISPTIRYLVEKMCDTLNPLGI